MLYPTELPGRFSASTLACLFMFASFWLVCHGKPLIVFPPA